MVERTKTCPHCGESFSYPVERGKDRKFCSSLCRDRDCTERKRLTGKPCTNPSCQKVAMVAGYCDGCYARIRRKGTLEYFKPEEIKTHTHGYLLVFAPDHPLTMRHSGPREYQHRIVFYDANGEGPFNCHWCGCDVTWADMHVDHVNAIKDDNRIENLVASCAGCNQKRGHEKMIQTVRKRRAIWIEYNGQRKTLKEWADEIGIVRESLKFRLKSGWSIERALTTPRGITGPKRQQVG
jgi:hypothetical protein